MIPRHVIRVLLNSHREFIAVTLMLHNWQNHPQLEFAMRTGVLVM